MSPGSDEAARLERWTASGGRWTVVTRSPTTLTVALLTCDGGEEMDRIVSGTPEFAAYVGSRWDSDQPVMDEE
ncbi:hypothetical protein [Nocardioides gilvus]|uniref:hypothetical protein n=1 Tax=Nocardioides gilvus TaxID=1735589 RepID=UPI000D7476B2|nr:hypothetical protein [Nocardioides gilvus]